MTPPVLAPSRTAPIEVGIVEAAAESDRRLSSLIEEFLAAHEASVEASGRARLADSVVLDGEAERLHGDAEDAWMKVASGWAANSFVPGDVLNLGREYEASRSQVPMPARAAAGDWRNSIATVDWSRSRS